MPTQNNNISNESIQQNFFKIVILLFLITSISRLAMSLYLPALPDIGTDLNIEETILGLSLTVYFGGFAFFTLIAGPLSDAFGRRRVLLIGGLVFLIGSSVCGLAQGGSSLLFGRLLQAIGACTIPVTALAVTRDAFDDKQVVTVLGWMGAFGALIPALAPILGGAITEFAGWRYTFLFLVISCFLVLSFAYKNLPETLPMDRRQPINPAQTFKTFGLMLSNSRFLFAIAPIFFCFAIQGVYFACAPFVFIQDMGLTPTQFGMTNMVLVATLVLGRVMCAILIKRFGQSTTYVISGIIALCAGIGFTTLFFVVHPALWVILLPAALFGLAFGTMVPIGLKEVLTIFKQQSGTASALYGCLTLGASGLSSALAGISMDMEFKAIYVMAMIATFCCIMIFLTTLFSNLDG